MAAGVVHIPWYATLFRGDQLAAARGRDRAGRRCATARRTTSSIATATTCTSSCSARRSRARREFEAYWYGPEMNELPDGLLGLVPGADPLHLGRPGGLGRPSTANGQS